jgi:hypothetical protein
MIQNKEEFYQELSNILNASDKVFEYLVNNFDAELFNAMENKFENDPRTINLNKNMAKLSELVSDIE